MESKLNVYQKVFNLKSEVGKLAKTETNPFFKSKYFDINQMLEVLSPLLSKNKLILLQPIIDEHVVTQIIDIDSGETLSSSLPLLRQNDPQETGSEITYYRRYTLQSLLGLQAEDDDGNDAKPEKTYTSIPVTEWLSDSLFKEAIKSNDVKYLIDLGQYWSTAPKGMKAEYRKSIKGRIKELKTQL